MKKSKLLTAVFLLLFFAGIVPAQAGTTKTWIATTGDWFTVANWGGNPYPTNGDDVVITNSGASVLLTNSTAYLSSITLSAPGLSTNTLVFSNWNTTLSSTNVYVRSNATVTLPPAFTDVQMSNNVRVLCSNLTVETGGKIDADGKGYSGGLAGHPAGYGPGAATNYNGGGYGGFGGGYQYPWYIGIVYGSVSAPNAPGSGGGGQRTAGISTPGGGAVWIQADGTVVVNGTITANGLDATGYPDNYVGCGSGGGIYIQCDRFAGTNGVLSAKGGGGLTTSGPGGGGRIAVVYNPVSQNAMPKPTVQILTTPGYVSSFPNARAGTIYLPDNRFLSAINTNISGNMYGFSSWTTSSLTISNVWFGFPEEGFALTVTNDITIVGSTARLELGGNQGMYTNSKLFIYNQTNGPVLNCGGSLMLTNGGCLYVYNGLTNQAMPGWGALVSVTGNIVVASANSWIYPVSHPTNGASVFFRAGTVKVQVASAGFDAAKLGFAGGWQLSAAGMGPGAGLTGCAGGYGGFGGGATNVNSLTSGTYGSPDAPVQPGSSGWSGGSISALSPNGGGLVRIQAAGVVLVNGTIQADGGTGPGNGGRASSGGGVYITCDTFVGTNGSITAKGGDGGDCYSGGGGRIAIVYNTVSQGSAPVPTVTLNAASGAPIVNYQRGDVGTIYLPDTRLLTERLAHSGQFVIPGFTRWSPNNLTIVTNAWIAFRSEGFQLAVTNTLTIDGASAKLELGGNQSRFAAADRFPFTEINGPTLTCADLVVTNAGGLYIYSGLTNSQGTGAYGALVNVSRDIMIASNSWVYPASHPTNGASVFFQAKNLTIPGTNGGFNASEIGFAGGNAAIPHKEGWGPGAGIFAGGNYGGGGYGGFGGGYSFGAGGATYGSSNAPTQAGSGGYGHVNWGKSGGGLVWVEARSTMTINGQILANGGDRASGDWGGAGSGGGIYLKSKNFNASSTGQLSARGGSKGSLDGSAGGGGRIAVWRIVDTSTGTISTSATNGTGATIGTIVWGWLPPPGTVFTIH